MFHFFDYKICSSIIGKNCAGIGLCFCNRVPNVHFTRLLVL